MADPDALLTSDDADMMTAFPTPESRLHALRKSLSASLENIAHAARVFATMEAAGDDVSGLGRHLIGMLRAVNAKRMLPEVVHLQGRLRTAAARLPLTQQQRVIDGKPVQLVVLRDEGTDIRMLDPRKLEPEQVMQVFGPQGIRDETEQCAWLEARNAARRAEKPPSQDIEVHKRRGVVVIKGRTLTRKDLLRLLEELE